MHLRGCFTDLRAWRVPTLIFPSAVAPHILDMIQKGVCCFFQNHCVHPSREPIDFLSLPERVRDQIYSEAGVISGECLHVVGYDRLRDLERRQQPLTLLNGDTDVFCLRISLKRSPFLVGWQTGEVHNNIVYSLNETGGVIHADITRFIVAHNELLLCCDGSEGLCTFLEIPSWLLNHMKHLTVHLMLYTSQLRRCYGHYWSCCHRMGDYHAKQHPISSPRKFKAMLPLWQSMLDRLHDTADRSQLRLCVLSDADNAVKARPTVEPLRLLDLQKLTVGFTNDENSDLKIITRQATDRSVTDPNGPSRLLNLCSELRQEILALTDLVTPRRKIVVNVRRLPRWFAMAPDTAEHCTNTREFCLEHIVSPPCGCWTPPESMFLICKQLLPDVRAVFFSSNRFVIDQYYSRDYPLNAATFLTQIVPVESLSSLRSLHLSFSPVWYDLSEADKAIYRDWMCAIELVAPNVKKLAIQVRLNHWFDPNRFHPDELTNEESWQQLLNIQEQLLRPLRKFRQLSRFFVYLIPSWRSVNIRTQQVCEYEKRMETIVMGEDYNSIREGKSIEPKRPTAGYSFVSRYLRREESPNPSYY
jgi:hypothetical protein